MLLLLASRVYAQERKEFGSLYRIISIVFSIDRGLELRLNLENAMSFIGENFKDYKECFTFMFTLCSTALATLREIGIVTSTTKERGRLLRYLTKERR